MASALLRLLADLGDHDEVRRAADVLHRALSTAQSPADIDEQIGKENKLFEQIYTNLYVNDEGEALLDLFARTLDADAPDLLAAVQAGAVDLARTLDFDQAPTRTSSLNRNAAARAAICLTKTGGVGHDYSRLVVQ
ncbi:MAG: hypothetical protein WKG07_06025 [Hymenobacter sp.]